MNISDAKRFEYTVHLFKEYLSSRCRKDYPSYQIVWKMNNSLVTGHLLRWNKSNFPSVVKLKVGDEFAVYDEILPLDDDHQDEFPRDMRNCWYDKYQTHWGVPEPIYLNPVALLLESRKFVSSNNFNEIADDQSILYDVNYLQNSVKLAFLKLDDDTNIEPVSLIKLSQN